MSLLKHGCLMVKTQALIAYVAWLFMQICGLSHDDLSQSDIRPCIKINKLLGKPCILSLFLQLVK